MNKNKNNNRETMRTTVSRTCVNVSISAASYKDDRVKKMLKHDVERVYLTRQTETTNPIIATTSSKRDIKARRLIGGIYFFDANLERYQTLIKHTRNNKTNNEIAYLHV